MALFIQPLAHPWPNGDGPIEASSSFVSLAFCFSIRGPTATAQLKQIDLDLLALQRFCHHPWPNGDGPIEAAERSADCAPPPGHPWPNGDGPIEAKILATRGAL